MNTIEETFEQIKRDIASNNIVLYMKGTKSFPQCGFSSLVVSVLKKMGANFKDINILESDLLRQAIKEYSNWPTIPQLYVKGEFIGGSDIIKEMYETGELENLFSSKNIPYEKQK